MLIRHIAIKNILSFDSSGVALDLKKLNVLIGANGSGKSNFMEAISLLQSAPKYLASTVRESGGISTWLFKGVQFPTGQIEVVTDLSDSKQYANIKHAISFREISNKFDLCDERIENSKPNNGELEPYFYYKFQNNHPVLNGAKGSRSRRILERVEIDPEQSILSQIKDPGQYPEIAELAKEYGKIKIYREWTFGRNAMPRLPQKPDERNDYLYESSNNLGLILNKIATYHPIIKKKLIEKMRLLYPRFDDYSAHIEGGSVQVFFTEDNFPIPATRLSDGTLRYLSLLAILLNPTKPSLVCIEEPELGLHTDILPTVAELLKEASEEMQIIVTTHSDVIVDALSDTPEDVIVCENKQGFTTMNRLNSDDLKDWLEKYTLGQLWSMGEIGGNRF